mmetsp:Transcript_12612/g.37811  ORF Transcript_12612/g.37811 Transcript_12612/m.37811 type:complete len:230 (+) Transcript_12612:238-927(+)
MSGVFSDVLRMMTDVSESPGIGISVDDVDLDLGSFAASPSVAASPGDPLRNLSNEGPPPTSGSGAIHHLKPDPKQAWLRGRKRRASSALSLGFDLDFDLPPPSPPAPRSSTKKSRNENGLLSPRFLADMGLRKSLIDILNVFNSPAADGADKSHSLIEEVQEVPPPGPIAHHPHHPGAAAAAAAAAAAHFDVGSRGHRPTTGATARHQRPNHPTGIRYSRVLTGRGRCE